MKAGEYGLLYEKIDEEGWPIEVRVGRHCSTVLQLVQIYSDMNQDKAITISQVPRYAEVIEKGVGHYLYDPSSVSPDRVVYE